jgi:signal peptidase I
MRKKGSKRQLLILGLFTVIFLIFWVFDVSRLRFTWGIFAFITGIVIALVSLWLVQERKRSKTSVSEDFTDWLSFLGKSLMVIAIVFTFFLFPSSVHGISMRDTLSTNDRLLIYHFNYEVKRNDIVIVRVPSVIQGERFLVKRILIMPGDHVAFSSFDDSSNYRIEVNGRELTAPDGTYYVLEDWQRCKLLGASIAADGYVRNDNYFAFGDNPEHSTDSRYYGAFSQEDIIGKAIWQYWPPGGLS